jgi:multimeric flavodoxin WrbA
MSKKILVLSASPRKGGNSDLLCDQFMIGAEKAGNPTEKIFLRDKKSITAQDVEPVITWEQAAPKKMIWLRS